ncbi:FliM/FliN family flagellar motor C-terminal domain-containing protein [Parachitinimonas caeni]|uniref:FliM/FliN family flagellar motor C-terminal domain-containing protein n=1 Tax=Parachitinimonas caeni TaxID=3031301 RepID=A0ABT7DYI6_9NEIS|nr:FliM/FliN family flagellar motor C-terminal domain-containing protein [Parachitinimonas caeni]MDK2125131.1 FliM/FliN family flagellar motor C-terminal domain-containing protein [Parachitinimonas caeni]
MESRRFVLYRPAILAQVEEQLLAVLQSWAQPWGLDTKLFAIHVEPAHQVAQVARLQGRHWHTAKGDSVWLGLGEGMLRAIEQRLFSRDHSDPDTENHRDSTLASEIAGEAATDLLNTLHRHWVGEGATELAACAVPKSARGDGALICTLSLGPRSAYLYLGSGLFSKSLSKPAARGKLALLPAALTHQRLQLALELGEVTLTLGQLETLAIGDVVRLGTNIDQPAKLITTDGRMVCHGHIGACEGVRAVEVFK